MIVHMAAWPDGKTVRVGFVVSKAVGNAVTRNRVKRRLRHLAAGARVKTPAGTDVVVRALPVAVERDALRLDLEAAWTQAVGRLYREPVGQ